MKCERKQARTNKENKGIEKPSNQADALREIQKECALQQVDFFAKCNCVVAAAGHI